MASLSVLTEDECSSRMAKSESSPLVSDDYVVYWLVCIGGYINRYVPPRK